MAVGHIDYSVRNPSPVGWPGLRRHPILSEHVHYVWTWTGLSWPSNQCWEISLYWNWPARGCIPCCDISRITGATLQWVDIIRYLGYLFGIVRSRTFKFCSDNEQSLYRAFYTLCDKIAKAASEEVTLSLVKAKCMPSLRHGLEACPNHGNELTPKISKLYWPRSTV